MFYLFPEQAVSYDLSIKITFFASDISSIFFFCINFTSSNPNVVTDWHRETIDNILDPDSAND